MADGLTILITDYIGNGIIRRQDNLTMWSFAEKAIWQTGISIIMIIIILILLFWSIILILFWLLILKNILFNMSYILAHIGLLRNKTS